MEHCHHTKNINLKMVQQHRKLNIILIFICFLFLFQISIYAKHICGDDVWLGFANIYYENLNYGSVPMVDTNNNIKSKKYGKYAFDYKTNLIELLTEIDSEYFSKYIEYGRGSEKLINEEDGLPEAFSTYYANNKKHVEEVEDKYLYNNYYIKAKDALNEKGIDLSIYSEYIKGAVLSYTLHKLEKNIISQSINGAFINDIKDVFSEETEDAIIIRLYKIMDDKFGQSEEESKKLFKERNKCLEKSDDGEEYFEGGRLVIDNSIYSDKYTKDINATASFIYDEFLTNGKIYEEVQLEWYDNVRYDIDYSDEINITSGFLDIATETSKGIKQERIIDKIESELVLKEIDNGQGIIYVPQNPVIESYAYLKFASNNVAQGGGSIACLSMAINKLLNKSGNFLITPDKILSKITEEKGDCNTYYNEEKKGMENEIITEVAELYGLKSSIIAKDSISTVLSTNGLVIARVNESEFSNVGNFVLLSGYEEKNGQMCCYVIDPNIAHVRLLYNLYNIDYIKSISDVVFQIKV